MGFLDRVIRGAEYRSGLATPQGWMLDAFGGSRTVAGQRVNVHTAFGLSPVFSAVAMIADAVGRMPLKVYREVADPAGDDAERVEARQHRAWRMLHDSPNPYTPSNRFWSTVTAHLLLWGNAYIEKRRTDGILVDELYLLDPAKTSVLWDDRLKIKAFRQEPGNTPGASQDRVRTWTEDEVLHVFGLSLDGVTGVSRIHWCRNMLGTAQAREEFEGGFYQRGAVFSGVLQRPETAPELGDDGIRNLQAWFRSMFGGAAKKGFDVPVLEEGMTFNNVGMPLDDAQFVQSQQLSRTDIAVLFGLPPAFLGGATGESLTYSTVESNQLQFVQHAVMPWTETIAKALVTDPSIFPQNVFTPEFVVEALLRADANARADFYTKLAGVKAITVNEIRAKENMPPVPGGDELGSSIPETARETIPDPAAATAGTGGANTGTGNGKVPAALAPGAAAAASNGG